MKNNILCYVQRSLITKWKRLVLTHDEPLFVYGSNDDHVFAKRLKDGGVLWVIASIPDRPPELVARLDVELVLKRNDPKLDINPRFLQEFNYTWIAKGHNSSAFFGHNNAESALLQLAFRPKNGRPWKIDEGAVQWKRKYGNKLQSPRFICESGDFENGVVSLGSQPLIDLQNKRSRAIFLSWKWRDHKKSFIRSLAYELIAMGFMPWLDLLAMPWSRDLEQREKDKPKLNRLLKYGYQQAAVIVAIDSKHYGAPTEDYPNWTEREWEGKLEMNDTLKKIVYRPEGHKPSKLIQNSKADFSVIDQTPAEFAHELQAWFEKNMNR